MDHIATDEPTTAPARQVTLSGQIIQLTPPSSVTVCREILLAAGTNYQRACTAALALCWPPDPRARKRKKKGGDQLRRPAITYSGCGFNPLHLGGEFGDALDASGVPYEEVLTAGLVAFLLTAAQLPDSDDEETAAGN